MSETAILLIGALAALNFVIAPALGFAVARRRHGGGHDAPAPRIPLRDLSAAVPHHGSGGRPRRFARELSVVNQGRSTRMEQLSSTATIPDDPGSEAIFRAVFRLTAIADLYGPDRAVEWAQTLLDDPDLLRAFAHPPHSASSASI